jgi:hypothetical protein
VGSPIAASSNFDTNTSSTTLPLPLGGSGGGGGGDSAFDTNASGSTLLPLPAGYYAGVVQVEAENDDGLSSSEEEGEEEVEDVATWAALTSARPSDSSSSASASFLSDGEEGVGGVEGGRRLSSAMAASMRIGERAATPAEMRRGMGLPLTPQGFELADDWESYYYYYADGLGAGEASPPYPYHPRGGLSEQARSRLPTSKATAAELGESTVVV